MYHPRVETFPFRPFSVYVPPNSVIQNSTNQNHTVKLCSSNFWEATREGTVASFHSFSPVGVFSSHTLPFFDGMTFTSQHSLVVITRKYVDSQHSLVVIIRKQNMIKPIPETFCYKSPNNTESGSNTVPVYVPTCVWMYRRKYKLRTFYQFFYQ